MGSRRWGIVLLVTGIVVLVGGYVIAISSDLPVVLPLAVGLGLISAGTTTIRRARGSEAPPPPPR